MHRGRQSTFTRRYEAKELLGNLLTKYRRHTDPDGGHDQNQIKLTQPLRKVCIGNRNIAQFCLKYFSRLFRFI